MIFIICAQYFDFKAAAKAAGRSGHRSTATRQTSDESNDGKLRSPMRNANLRTNPMTNNIAVANQGCNFEAALQVKKRAFSHITKPLRSKWL